MYKFLALSALLFIAVQAANNSQLSQELDEMIRIVNSIKYEQLKRAISIIVQKKELAKEKGNEAVNCVEMEGNKYLQQIENNNVESTSALLEKLNGYKKDLEKGKENDVEQALKGPLKSEFETVLTNWQAKGETITLAFVAKANQCRGLDH